MNEVEQVITKLENLGYSVVDQPDSGMIEVRLITNKNFGIMQMVTYDTIIIHPDKVVGNIVRNMNQSVREFM